MQYYDLELMFLHLFYKATTNQAAKIKGEHIAKK